MNRNITISIRNKIKESYGFVANPRHSPSQNASMLIKHMPTWHYFTRPSNMAMHDLTTKDTPIPKSLTTIIGLGLKFIPTPRRPNRKPTSSFDRFRKDFNTKVFFSGRPLPEDKKYNNKMQVASEWEPKPWDIPETIHDRLTHFRRQILREMKIKRPRTTNLLPFQTRALSKLAQRTDVLVVSCDKNLGPALINTSTYIDRAFTDHLNCRTTYKELTEEEAHFHMSKVAKTIWEWMIKYSTTTKKHKGICRKELSFLQANFEPENAKLPVFYLTLKVHKNPWTTRPIVSCSGSLLYHLGIWVDSHLQKMATVQKTYIKNSRELKELITLQLRTLPPGAKLFTADATSMYTNINTGMAIIEIAQYLHQRSNQFATIPADALIDALTIIMRNNVFRFGDTFWHQLQGTAMGTPPAPTYANLFFAIHENRILPKYSTNLLVHKRYIDDIFGIWIPSADKAKDEEQWKKYVSDIDNYHGLKWIFSPRCKTVDFLDITISIKHDNTVHTTLFEKSLNLYLYIPPHSAHPPGVLTGLVIGNCHRVYTLCSDEADRTQNLRHFFRRLRARGYTSHTLIPLFHRAQQLALNPPVDKALCDEVEDNKKRVFFHLEYHPDSPRSPELQSIWKNTVIQPPSAEHLSLVQNMADKDVEVQQMTVAYSRPRNLGNLLSPRNLHISKGLPVSSYRK